MLERIELANEPDARDEIARWRYATDAERSRAIVELAAFAQAVIRSRGFPDNRPPLNYPRIPNVSR
jgi:hypothetical protein